MRADDHGVGRVGHPALDAVDVRLRVIGYPSLVAPVLGRVDRRYEGDRSAARERSRGTRHQPVVAVDEVEPAALDQLLAGGDHVVVHPVHPADELLEVPRALGLADPVHAHAVQLVADNRFAASSVAAAG